MLSKIKVNFLFTIVNLDDPLEFSNSFYFVNLSRCIKFWLLTEETTRVSSLSTSFQRLIIENLFRHNFFYVLKLIRVVPSVMFTVVSRYLIEPESNEKGRGRRINFPINFESIVKSIFRLDNNCMRISRALKFVVVLLPLVVQFTFSFFFCLSSNFL